jgi:hypothetical protein
MFLHRFGLLIRPIFWKVQAFKACFAGPFFVFADTAEGERGEEGRGLPWSEQQKEFVFVQGKLVRHRVSRSVVVGWLHEAAS